MNKVMFVSLVLAFMLSGTLHAVGITLANRTNVTFTIYGNPNKRIHPNDSPVFLEGLSYGESHNLLQAPNGDVINLLPFADKINYTIAIKRPDGTLAWSQQQQFPQEPAANQNWQSGATVRSQYSGMWDIIQDANGNFALQQRYI
ncbi:hypothetical protein M1466_02555 [Candidatus Dependentiae bacterium]|nr:hypothetical protein [Candidatus Dependentiae bacterium]